jgi:hypothetical protein
MRAHLVAGIVLACATMAVGAQTDSKSSASSQATSASSPQATSPSSSQPGAASTSQAPPTPAPQPTPDKKPVKAVTLTGCLQGSDEPGTGLFTLVDAKGATTYSVSGTDVSPHVGHRVKIVGGLLPSPNVAAQAGAIDPVQAAIASSEHGTGSADVHLELHVTRVQPLSGDCGQRR